MGDKSYREECNQSQEDVSELGAFVEHGGAFNLATRTLRIWQIATENPVWREPTACDANK
jgi:hypothetical protein